MSDSPQFTIARIAALHRVERRYQVPEVLECSFDTPEEALEYADGGVVSFFEICAECGRIESDQVREFGSDWAYREALWPCRTATMLLTPTDPKGTE